MPPRTGLFRRLVQGIERIFRGGEREREPSREPSRPPPRLPPRPPPRPPEIPPEPPPRDRRADYREIWNDEASDRVIAEIHDATGRSESEIFLDLFRPFYVLVSEEDRATQLEMWRDYIDAFVNDDETFTKNDYFAKWDIARSSFDWQAWRDARGYSKRK